LGECSTPLPLSCSFADASSSLVIEDSDAKLISGMSVYGNIEINSDDNNKNNLL